MSEVARHRFRHDIEGLRALAIVLMLLYQLGVLPGGYVGIDIFLVVSGYLVSGMLLRELRNAGRINLTQFWAKRALRLVPAAVLVTTATLAAAAFLMPPQVARTIAGDALASSLLIANLHHAAAALDYVGAGGPTSPLLHLWFLALEAQFLLLWPLLLALAWRLGARTRGIGALFFSLTSLSLALCYVLTGLAAPWAYFSLPTRLWEFGLGALLALGPEESDGQQTRGLALPGLGLMLTAGALFGTTTAFPGIAALAPAGGAALVIAGGTSRVPGPATWLLSLRIVGALARIAYPLYLWRLPAVLVPAALIAGPMSKEITAVLLGVAIVLALLTVRLLERPVRYSALAAHRPGLALLICAAALLATAAASVGARAVVEQRSVPATAITPDPRVAHADLPVTETDGCVVDVLPLTSPDCLYGDLSSSRTLVLFGDSHAAQWVPAFEVIARQRGMRLLVLAKATCPPHDITVWSEPLQRPYDACDAWREHAYRRIAQASPAIIIVSGARRSADILHEGQRREIAESPAVWAAALGRTLDRLTGTGAALVVLGDTPQLPFNTATCLIASEVSDCTVERARATLDHVMQAERSMAAGRAVYIDPAVWMCPDECLAVIDRLMVYRGDFHITATYARSRAEAIAALLPR